jgi:type IV secretion system protein VirB10
MKIFSSTPPGQELGAEVETPREDAAAEPAAQPIAGDRGIPSINRARSVQSRISSMLAVGLMGALSLGLLTWYYAKALSRPARAQHAAQMASQSRARGEMPLPSLGPIDSPFTRKDPTPTAPTPQAADPTAMEQLLGSAPTSPITGITAVGTQASIGQQGVPAGPPAKSPGELAFERRLAGPAFVRSSKDPSTSPQADSGTPAADPAVLAAPNLPSGVGDQPQTSAQGLKTLLRPTVIPAVAASVLPTRRFLLAKGAFIDCTLETAIDSTLPGMTTCITATDTFSADGTVVLLERGTKLVGETRGEVQQGSARIFVLWTEARTPTGVVVPLSSPGTDELGRSGLPGEVNRHFWDRFGAAILMTVINGAVQGAVNSQNKSGSVSISPSTSTDVMSEVLRSTVNIPPTVTKAQGDRIQVFVARDVDFRPVYALRVAGSAATTEKTP